MSTISPSTINRVPSNAKLNKVPGSTFTKAAIKKIPNPIVSPEIGSPNGILEIGTGPKV